MTPTKYRTINDGWKDYLQYESERTFLLFFKKKVWCFVPKPYLEWPYPRGSFALIGIFGVCDREVVTEYNTDIQKFIKDYPDISSYWPVFEFEQTKLLARFQEKESEINSKKGKVREL